MMSSFEGKTIPRHRVTRLNYIDCIIASDQQCLVFKERH